jgi:hypothetical protein
MCFSVSFPGLGLGTGSSGRRDSFDRNTSAFSPSLDYGRPKWPQNYGALGKLPYQVSIREVVLPVNPFTVAY